VRLRDAALLALSCAGLACSDGAAPAAQAPAPARGAAESAEEPAELARARARIRELEVELQGLRDERVEREREWLEYTQTIARLGSIAELERARFQPAVEPPAVPAVGAEQVPPSAPAAPVDPAAEARAARGAEIARSLRALLFAEEVHGLQLLEAGALLDGALGPVVLRLFDAHGRPYSALCAERLRLEASQAARTITLVLEDGYERQGELRIPFEVEQVSDASAPDPQAPAPERSGVRRIALAHVDPRPWIEAVPELLRPRDKLEALDDGRWDLAGVRATLNALLALDVSSGRWRVEALGGVVGDEVRDVQLDVLDEHGRLEKKLFADRLVIRARERGLVLELQDGAQLRGDVKTPFLDGHYRIFLPRADPAEWARARLPGLSEPPPRRARR